MKVSVLGSGNGGCAVAFDYAQHGHEVSLFDFEEFDANIAAVNDRGGIASTGELEGFAELRYAGHDIEEALRDAELVFAVGPAFSTEPFAKAARPQLRAGQVVVVCPSSCAGSLVFKNALGVAPDSPEYVVGETSTLPYAVRVVEPGVIKVFLKLRAGIYLAALPSRRSGDVYALVERVYPGTEQVRSVFQTTLQNGNPVIHPAVTLLNAALIERTHGSFNFYEDGVTEAVGRLIQGLDRERLAVAGALGVPVLSEPAIGVLQGYMREDSYSTGYATAPGFLGIKAQDRLDHRYLTEDVGYGLVFLSDLAARVGVPTPVVDAVIELASVVLGRDFRAERARTLETLGLAGYSAEQLAAL